MSAQPAYRVYSPRGAEGAVFIAGRDSGGSSMRHMHDGFSIGVAEIGSWQARYRGIDHAIGPGVVQLARAGETSECVFSAGTRGFRVLNLPQQLLQDTVEGLWDDRVRVEDLDLREHAVIDDDTAHLLRRLEIACAADASALSQVSVVQEIVLAVLSRYGVARSAAGLPSLAVADGIVVAREYIDDAPGADPSLSELAALAGLSEFHFNRQFRKLTGLPPHAYQLHRRIEVSKSRLRRGGDPLAIALTLGFYDQSHFIRHFRRQTGMTPGAYRTAAGFEQ